MTHNNFLAFIKFKKIQAFLKKSRFFFHLINVESTTCNTKASNVVKRMV